MLLLYRFGRVHFLLALSAYLPALGRTLRLLLPNLGGRGRGRILYERRQGGLRRDLGLHLGLYLGHGRLAHLQVHSGQLDILRLVNDGAHQ